MQSIGVEYVFRSLLEVALNDVLTQRLYVQSAEEITQIVTEAQNGDNNEDDVVKDEYVDDYMDQSANIDDWRPQNSL